MAVANYMFYNFGRPNTKQIFLIAAGTPGENVGEYVYDTFIT